MAWISVDTNLREKPEFCRIAELTGESDDVIAGRLVLFWSWVDGATADGKAPGVTYFTLKRMFGGDESFWKALEDEKVSWLKMEGGDLIVPEYEKRFSQSAKKRANDAQRISKKRKTKTDENGDVAQEATNVAFDANKMRPRGEERRGEKEKISPRSAPKGCAEAGKTWSQAEHDVPVEAVIEVADELFRQTGYTGTDGGIFWKAAAVLHVVPGSLTRAKLASIAARTKEAKGDKAAYFRKALRGECNDFEDRLKQVWVTPGWPKKPPNARAGPEIVTVSLRKATVGNRNAHDVAAELERQADQEARS